MNTAVIYSTKSDKKLLFQAAILQQTAEYIYSLEQEKTRLLSQNCQLKRLVNQQQHEVGELPPKKRKTDVILTNAIESTEECVETITPEPINIMAVAVDPSENTELQRQLERERGMRVVMEERIRQVRYQNPSVFRFVLLESKKLLLYMHWEQIMTYIGSKGATS